jgi:hypothetical protein
MAQITGSMALIGVEMSAISLVVIVMNVDISVEFTAHLVLAYLDVAEPTRAEAVQAALAVMFAPILDGAWCPAARFPSLNVSLQLAGGLSTEHKREEIDVCCSDRDRHRTLYCCMYTDWEHPRESFPFTKQKWGGGCTGFVHSWPDGDIRVTHNQAAGTLSRNLPQRIGKRRRSIVSESRRPREFVL